MAEIKLNGERRKFESACSAEDFLRSAGFEPSSAIVVLNGDVIESEALAKTALKDGDELDLLKLAGGG